MTDGHATGMPIPAPVALSGSAPADLASRSEQPLKEILVELWENTEKLIRQEAALANAEIDRKVAKLKGEATAFALGGAALHAALLALTAGVILALAQIMAAWLAALAVGLLLAGAGYALVKRQPRLERDDFIPSQTIESAKKDAKTFTEALK